MKISKLVMNQRDRLKMTQADFAKACGLSQAKVSKVENGRQGLTVSDLMKILKATKMKMIIKKETKV